MVHMLSEEALILAAVLVACGLLLLGVMELLWPTRRRVVRRPPDLMRRRQANLRPEVIARRVLEAAQRPQGEPVPIPLPVPVQLITASRLTNALLRGKSMSHVIYLLNSCSQNLMLAPGALPA